MPDLSLKPLPNYKSFPGPVVFVLMDGVGIGKRDESDGVWLAYTPVLDELFKERLYTQLKAHGTAVGMPSDEDMGNSEVGHNALGAGRVFAQGAKLVSEAIASGRLFDSAAWKSATAKAKAGGTLHLIGLLSGGNVHSHINHVLALDRCAAEGVARARLHVLADGRDVGERSALGYIATLENNLAELNAKRSDYRIASGGGRMNVTMDRYNADWSIVERGWKAHVLGEGRQFASAAEAVQTYYDEDPNITDQYLESFVIAENKKPIGTIDDGDAVIFFNFRGDRGIEITKAFEEGAEFDKFDRKRRPDVFYAGMMQYDGDAGEELSGRAAAIERTVGQYMCAQGITTFESPRRKSSGHITISEATTPATSTKSWRPTSRCRPTASPSISGPG